MHHLNCSAPICAGDPEKNWQKTVLWYPGEPVCSIKATKWQKNQRRINKLVLKGGFKNMDRYFTADSLSKIGRVTNATKGK